MKIELIRGLYNLKSQHKGCVMAIGSFDGVHLGHQALISKVKKKAHELGVPSMVMTFEPLPKEYFGRNKSMPRLTRLREKLSLFAKYGIDKVFVVNFNAKLAALSAEDFVKTILVEGLNVKHVIVGDDFRFGRARLGDFHFLQTAGEHQGFSVENMISVMIDQQRVSSTLVREALAQGDHSFAEKCLGRSFAMRGRIMRGDQRGRSMGFPTANIHLHRNVTPVQGVYAVQVYGIAPQGLPGVANVGVRPTIGGTRSLLEVHLFDFDEDIYGRYVQVKFCKKLRDEKRFESLDLLIEQIWKDAAEARNYFDR